MIEKEISFSLPTHLEGFREPLQNSAQPYIKIHPSHLATTVTQSKVGGIPYSPKGATLPLDLHGEQMVLLAQINFAESAFPTPFPTTGLLQIFVSPAIFHQAAEFTGTISPHWYKTRFFEQLIEADEQEATELTQPALFSSFAMHFSSEFEPVSLTDYRLPQYISQQMVTDFTTSSYQPFHELYAQSFLAADQKIGGYPYFLEEDFRAENPQHTQFDTMLLQLVSDDDLDFVWGDSGVLKFFITSQDLAQKNFSTILFYGESY